MCVYLRGTRVSCTKLLFIFEFEYCQQYLDICIKVQHFVFQVTRPTSGNATIEVSSGENKIMKRPEPTPGVSGAIVLFYGHRRCVHPVGMPMNCPPPRGENIMNRLFDWIKTCNFLKLHETVNDLAFASHSTSFVILSLSVVRIAFVAVVGARSVGRSVRTY